MKPWFMLALCLATCVCHPQGVSPIDQQFIVRSWRREHGLPENKLLSLLVDRAGHLWIGTRAGVARFDGRQFKVWSQSTDPAFAEDRDGRIWIGTVAGLEVWDGRRLQPVR